MSKQWNHPTDYKEPVLWGVVLYHGAGATHGTILNVTPHAWEIAGSLPIQQRMTLKMRIWPGYKRYPYLEIEEATVLWVKEGSFGVALTRVRERDQAAIFALEQKNFGVTPFAIEEVRYC